jgi:hypothetical protein
MQFNRKFFGSENRITFIGKGSSGGKAQGLISISEFLEDKFNADEFSGIEVKVPTFTVIRTDVFDAFMKSNKLYEIAFSDLPDDRIAHAFQKADLPFSVTGDLRSLVKEVHIPLAVRSSSRLEDAMYEPFAGIYSTKMTPNNQHDADSRFKKLIEAIKFVYASTYFKAAKDYMKATKHKIEDEKMAVIIQEVIGERHGERFYPGLSGVGRSFNFYPLGRVKPEDGIIDLALGLGKTIVDGGVAWSYSPAYPQISPPFGTKSDMLKQTQNKFWAVNMGKAPDYNPSKETEYMVEGNLEDAEQDGALQHVASTYNFESDRLSIGIGSEGVRVLTFSPLLELADIPLNNLARTLLKLCEESLNAPVEIEFAMTFSKTGVHKFGFLQVRPMVVSTEEIKIEEEELNAENVLSASENVLGNGIYDSITDIVYVIPDQFESKNTSQIAMELELVNNKLLSEGRSYLLIGFGRWGSSDPWLGIPVTWGQISAARVIVEATLENMNVELSQGSHFFHNLTSFDVSYFSLPFHGDYKMDWDWLEKQELLEEKQHIRHVQTSSAMLIKVDGRNGRGVILK